MKKLILMAAAALLLTTQCRKNADTLVTPSDGVKMTVTVNPGRVIVNGNGEIEWENNEMLYVSDGSGWIGCLTNGSEGGSTFSGNVVSFDKAKTYHFFYFSKLDVGTLTGTNNEVEISLAYQGGTMSGVSRHQLGHCATQFEEAESAGNTVMLKSMVALAKMDFIKSGTDYTGMVKLSGEGIANKVRVSPVFEDSKADPKTTFTGSDIYLGVTGTNTKYVMLAPASGPIEVNFNNDEKALRFDGGIEAGKYYGMNTALKVEFSADYNEEWCAEYVDLGLPSGKLWATHNLGATSPTGSGYYYAWGETEPYFKGGKWCEHPSHNASITFNNFVGYGWANYLDGSAELWDASKEWYPYDETTKLLKSECDAASIALVGDWCMPTDADFTELIDNTTRSWVEAEGQNTTAGYKVTSKAESNQSLFLPAASYRSGTGFNGEGTGNYWSSSRGGDVKLGRYLNFGLDNFGVNSKNRYLGFTVRPVRVGW